MTDVNSDEVTFDQVGCARCHGDGHPGITFKRLTHAFEPDGVEEAYTHWAPCPTNGEPIMLAFIDEPDDAFRSKAPQRRH